MSVDTSTTGTRVSDDGLPEYLTIRLAGGLLAGLGRMGFAQARRIAEETSGGGRPSQRVIKFMQPLADLGLVVFVDGVFYAPNTADLAAWVADAYADHDDSGHLFRWSIPSPRVA